MAPASTIALGGIDPFASQVAGVTYLGLEWVLNPIVRTDIAVPELLRSVGGDHYPSRRDELVRILDVDLSWRLHAVSDGERRRVQLCMGLLRPWTVLLLDEITVDLDLLSRHEFLSFLKRETEERSCSIVYATHILDNLAAWPTHLVHMSQGRVQKWGAMEEFTVPERWPRVWRCREHMLAVEDFQLQQLEGYEDSLLGFGFCDAHCDVAIVLRFLEGSLDCLAPC